MYKSAIHSNQFLVLELDRKSGNYSVIPEVFSSYATALHDAQKRAGYYPDYKYIVVAVAAVAQSSYNPVVTTTYHLEDD
jgi:hypothetical protein